MANKYLGLGTVVKKGTDAVTLVVSGTPPGKSRVRVDGTALSDTLQVYELGIEAFSEFVFDQFWHPGDTDHDAIDGLFDSKADTSFVIEFTAANRKWTFNGKVSDVEPQPVVHDGVLQRRVTIQRTGAITPAAIGA